MFKSQAQRRYLHATNPQLAAEFESKTPDGKKLPDHVAKRKTKKSKKVRRYT